jgi:hypothetical protein
MALAAPEGYDWIQKTLKADPVLQGSALGADPRVYQRDPPAGPPTYPYVLIRWVVGIPLVAIGAIDVWVNTVYDVIVVDRSNSTSEMKPIANRIDQVLNRQSGRSADGTIFFCCKAPNMSEIASTDPPAQSNPGGGARVQNLGRPWALTIKGD